MTDYPVTITETLPWQSQVSQYPAVGEPGISYYPGQVKAYGDPIHCLLYRSQHGIVVGILNYYAVDYPPWEVAGNVNVFVNPRRRRRGIGTALVREAQRRWGIDYRTQRYSAEGASLAQALDKGRGL